MFTVTGFYKAQGKTIEHTAKYECESANEQNYVKAVRYWHATIKKPHNWTQVYSVEWERSLQ
jgi:hypothetical protein